MPLIQRVLGVALGLLFLAAVLIFASIALAVLVTAGLAGWIWLWWRSRSKPQGRIIEGEYQRLEKDREDQRL
jgi:hypothetical protein